MQKKIEYETRYERTIEYEPLPEDKRYAAYKETNVARTGEKEEASVSYGLAAAADIEALEESAPLPGSVEDPRGREAWMIAVRKEKIPEIRERGLLPGDELRPESLLPLRDDAEYLFVDAETGDVTALSGEKVWEEEEEGEEREET